MGVIKFTRTVIIVITYLSFILFPLIFANSVYKSFDIEHCAKQSTAPNTSEELVDTYSLEGIVQSDYFNYSDCYDLMFKVGCALILSAWISNRKILKIGTI